MTPDEQGFHTRLVGLASMIPNFILTPELIELYDRMLSPLGYRRVNEALDQIIMERSSRDPFPSISEIKGIVEPTTDEKYKPTLMAGRIIQAVGRYGVPNLKLAKDSLYPEEWEVIRMWGGWERVCQDMPAGGGTFIRSQLEKLSAAVLDREKVMGPAIAAPEERKQIGSPTREGGAMAIGDILKIAQNQGGLNGQQEKGSEESRQEKVRQEKEVKH